MAIRVILSDRPAWALAESRPFLASQPVLHNLILTLLHARVTHPEPGRYWIAYQDGNVAGFVFQSPLHLAANLALMDSDSIAALVDAIADAGIALPGVSGEAATAARFAGQWTERCKSAAAPIRGDRLYEVTEVHEAPLVAGRLRNAGSADRDIVVNWLRDFEAETGTVVLDPELMVDRAIRIQPRERRSAAPHKSPQQRVLRGADHRLLWSAGCGAASESAVTGERFRIWHDAEPVSMAMSRECVEGVVRLAYVYTPPDKRGHGYAEACVNHLSREILGRGHRCILNTDLANPTSNSIYRRIGYRAVAEGLRYRFG